MYRLTLLAALGLMVPATGTAHAQRAADLRSVQAFATASRDRAVLRGSASQAEPAPKVHILISATERKPRWPRYAVIGGAVGFVASALIARSMICPGSDCIDVGEASAPIIGVVFYGLIGGGVGALLGAGTGAVVDARERERGR